MAETSGRELKRRREALRASLPTLSKNRANAYRQNSGALALRRTGVTYQAPKEMARLSAAEETADDAMRGVQREILQLDEEIVQASDGAFGSRVGRAVLRGQADR